MHGALGGFIRAARERAGLTQPQLAHHVYHSLSWIRRVEHGQGATITDVDAQRFAEVLHLQPFEVAYFHLMLGTSPPPTGPVDDSAMVAYINALDPHPAAWVSDDGTNHANDAFRRLLPDVVTAQFVGAWFFSEAAKEVILNWSAVADWWISDARFRIASNDHLFAGMVDRLLEALPEFKKLWHANPIPGNPEPPTWLIRVADGSVAELNFRAWWQSHRNGLLVQGVVAADPSLIHGI